MPKIPDNTVTHPDPGRWKALVFIALAQLMVVLDATIVNIALPSAQQDLGISDGNRQWVITAYALAFGGLLLFGGRGSRSPSSPVSTSASAPCASPASGAPTPWRTRPAPTAPSNSM